MARYRYQVEDFLGNIRPCFLEAETDELAVTEMRRQRKHETSGFVNKLLGVFSPSTSYGLERIDQDEVATPVKAEYAD